MFWSACFLQNVCLSCRIYLMIAVSVHNPKNAKRIAPSSEIMFICCSKISHFYLQKNVCKFVFWSTLINLLTISIHFWHSVFITIIHYNWKNLRWFILWQSFGWAAQAVEKNPSGPFPLTRLQWIWRSNKRVSSILKSASAWLHSRLAKKKEVATKCHISNTERIEVVINWTNAFLIRRRSSNTLIGCMERNTACLETLNSETHF